VVNDTDDDDLPMISVQLSLPQVQLFFLVVVRIGAIVMTMPVFRSNSIPILFKLGMAFAISMALFAVLDLDPVPVFNHVLPFAIGVIGELMIGISIGLAVRLIFAGIQIAGQLAGYQMGLAIANVMDPSSSQQLPILSQFNQLFAMLLLLVTNAHHIFLQALAESYRLVPPYGFHFSHSLMQQLVDLAAKMFVIAIQVGAPIIAALLLTSVAFGLIARTVPQMNVFIVAMPLKIGVGLLFLGFSLPYFSAFLNTLFRELGNNIFMLLKAMSS
jgi:flagellar biosynthetic protein FliR